MLRTADLEYDLPEGLIATSPAEPRDAARLMVVSRSDPSRLEHRHVRDLPEVLRSDDLLVFNTTRVLPARFLGTRMDTGGRVEGLYVGPGPEDGTWEVLLKSRRFKEGAPITLTDSAGRPAECSDPPGQVGLTLLSRVERGGSWLVRAEVVGPAGREPIAGGRAIEVLNQVGLTPIPPYIRGARRAAGVEVGEAADREGYQTVYATDPGSIAAPTAGLHFTPELLARLAAVGVGRADVTLHVGRGTFKPVETEAVEDHPMHAEWCSMSPQAVAAVGAARERGRRVIPVGTTSARTLETYAAAGAPAPESVRTRLLVTPGYQWRWVDGLLTNFHLPRSTLMAMVAALFPGGPARLREIYAGAVRGEYRFYSYGDAMLILP